MVLQALGQAAGIDRNHPGGDKSRPYGNHCRGGVYPLLFSVDSSDPAYA